MWSRWSEVSLNPAGSGTLLILAIDDFVVQVGISVVVVHERRAALAACPRRRRLVGYSWAALPAGSLRGNRC